MWMEGIFDEDEINTIDAPHDVSPVREMAFIPGISRTPSPLPERVVEVEPDEEVKEDDEMLQLIENLRNRKRKQEVPAVLSGDPNEGVNERAGTLGRKRPLPPGQAVPTKVPKKIDEKVLPPIENPQ